MMLVRMGQVVSWGLWWNKTGTLQDSGAWVALTSWSSKHSEVGHSLMHCTSREPALASLRKCTSDIREISDLLVVGLNFVQDQARYLPPLYTPKQVDMAYNLKHVDYFRIIGHWFWRTNRYRPVLWLLLVLNFAKLISLISMRPFNNNKQNPCS